MWPILYKNMHLWITFGLWAIFPIRVFMMTIIGGRLNNEFAQKCKM